MEPRTMCRQIQPLPVSVLNFVHRTKTIRL
uniref:Uncharacterized protein n=1 Tax=Rhizophora mucronata TaxID=61149 RepID=A0A2P2P4M4_RHIMU